jgi:hypothetical protein
MRPLIALAIAATLAVPARAQTTPAKETASDTYARYQAAISSATRLDDILTFWSADLVQQFNAAPPSQRVDLDGLKRIYSMVTKVTVVNETAGTSGTTLELAGVNGEGKKVTGTVAMRQEQGVWKIAAQESWRE